MKLLRAALLDYGEAETPGASTNNPNIVIWVHQAGIDPAFDETSWCGAAMRHWCDVAGLKAHVPKSPALARSWLNFGFGAVDPQLGDVVVFWREDPSSWKGHVGIFIRRSGGKVWVLGGNQSNSVSIAEHDVSRVLGYRRTA